MSYVQLQETNSGNVLIMIFAEGTILRPKSLFSLHNHQSYIPIGNCIEIIWHWQKQGTEIVYCTSRKGKQADEIAKLLLKHGFVGTRLYYRSDQMRKYKDLVENVKPTILIEDNCRSIGGAWQMCITDVEQSVKAQINSIVVKEFDGIDHLSKNLFDL